MAYILTRVDNGVPLTYHEVDSNFTNLNAGKLERTAITGVTGTITSSATTSTITSVSVDTLAVGMVLIKTAGTGILGSASTITAVDPVLNTITVTGSSAHTAGSVTFTARPALSGAFVTDLASLSVSGTVDITGTTTITGDLTVTGTTTNINTTNLVVEDKNIVLADVASPDDTSASGGGITLNGANNKTIIWQSTATSGNTTNTGYWNSTDNWNLNGSGKAYFINGTSVLSGTTLGSGVTASSLTSVGTLSSLAISVASGTTVPLTVTNAGTGDTCRFLDATGDTSIFRIDQSGLIGFGMATSDTIVAPLQYGTLGAGYTVAPADPLAIFATTVNSYNQFIIQNKSNGVNASSDFIVNNDVSTDSTFYGDFGINGSGYTVGGVFGDANGTYLYSNGGTLAIGTNTSHNFRIATNGTMAITIDTVQDVGIGVASPTAVLHLKAGTASANTAPLKFNSGTNLTSIEQGAVEFNGSSFFASPQTTYRGILPPVTFTSGLSASNGVNIVATTNYVLFPTANDSITLPIGLYRFELVIRIDTTAAVANVPLWTPIGNGNAVGTTSWQAISALTTGAAPGDMRSAQGINAATTTQFAATTSAAATRIIQIRGLLRITTAGTIIPTIQFSGAAGTMTTYADNYMLITPIATGTGTGSTATIGWA